MTAIEQLDQYRAGFANSREQLRSLSGPLSDEAFNWKPSPKSWSVGECIVHLNKVGSVYAPAMAEAVAASPSGDGPFQYGWFSRQFIGAVRPGSRAVPTVAGMKPPAAQGTQSSIDKARALDGLDRVTDQFIDVVDSAAGHDLKATRMSSPFLAVLRLPVGAFIEAMSLHALRHTAQAERVTAAPGFPGSTPAA